MSLFRYFIGYSLLALSLGTFAADEPLYIAEFIVFSHNNKDNQQAENWPRNIDITAQLPQAFLVNNNYRDIFTDPLDSSKDYSKQTLPLLPSSYYKMTAAAQQIDRLGRYQLVEHFAFAVRIGDKSQAPHIILDHDFINPQGQAARIGGSIQLSKNRYLHINTDLWLALWQDNAENSDYSSMAKKLDELATMDVSLAVAPNWPALPLKQNIESAADAKNYLNAQKRRSESPNIATESSYEANSDENIKLIAKIVQKRKMRSNERHYIDHPLMGIIIEIRPFEKPSE
jgi:hypothetical protein